MAPVIDFTGYQPPAPRVFAPCNTCSSTEHILCARDAGYLTYVDHTGTHTLRIKES